MQNAKFKHIDVRNRRVKIEAMFTPLPQATHCLHFVFEF
jgi:hypothetical protein